MFRKMRRYRQHLPENEAIRILEQGSSGVLAVLADVGNLVIAVGIVLASRHEGRTVRGIIGADIHHRAGRRTDDAQKRRDGQGRHHEPELFHRFHVNLPPVARRIALAAGHSLI